MSRWSSVPVQSLGAVFSRTKNSWLLLRLGPGPLLGDLRDCGRRVALPRCRRGRNSRVRVGGASAAPAATSSSLLASASAAASVASLTLTTAALAALAASTSAPPSSFLSHTFSTLELALRVLGGVSHHPCRRRVAGTPRW